jgi:hypothetical protein
MAPRAFEIARNSKLRGCTSMVGVTRGGATSAELDIQSTCTCGTVQQDEPCEGHRDVESQCGAASDLPLLQTSMRT